MKKSYKKIIVIGTCILIIVTLLVMINVVIPKRFISRFLMTRYDGVNNENLVDRHTTQATYFDKGIFEKYYPMDESMIEYFESNKTQVGLIKATIKVESIALDVMKMNAIYSVDFKSEVDEMWGQTTYYNVDFYLCRTGLFGYKIMRVIENSAVRALTGEDEHTHCEHKH